MCTNYYRFVYFKFAPATAYMSQFLPGKRTFYGRVLKLVACVALARKASDEIRITILLNLSWYVKKINELIVTSNKLTNTAAGLVTSGPRAASWTTLD
jgi:hypothetical protein